MKAGGKKVVRNATVAPATAPTRSVSSTQRRKKSAEPGAVETPPATAVVPDDATLAAMAKALGHPARVAILRVLAARDACVTGDLVTTIGLAQSTVSEHLRLLREAGLIQGEIEGPRTKYCVNRTGLQSLKTGITTR